MQFHWVYFAKNGAMPGLLKIGFTTRSPDDRLVELDTTGVPQPFEVAYVACVTNAQRLERELHLRLHLNRVRGGREFFAIQLAQARAILLDLCSDGTATLHFEKLVSDDAVDEALEDDDFTLEESGALEVELFEALAVLDMPMVRSRLPKFLVQCEPTDLNAQSLQYLGTYYGIPSEERRAIIAAAGPAISDYFRSWDGADQLLGIYAGYIYQLFGFRELGQIGCDEAQKRAITLPETCRHLLGAGAIAFFCGDKELGANLLRDNARAASNRYVPMKYPSAAWQYREAFWAIFMKGAEGDLLTAGEFELLQLLARNDPHIRRFWPSAANAIAKSLIDELATAAAEVGVYTWQPIPCNWEFGGRLQVRS